SARDIEEPAAPSEGGGALADADRFAPATDAPGRGLATLDDWEGDAIARNRIRLGLFDDRIRLTTSYANSRYSSDLRLPAQATLVAGRDPDPQVAGGHVSEAFSQRVEGSLWSTGSVRIDGFGSYLRVDPLFESNRSGSQDPFGKSGRRVLEAGGMLRTGPLGLALSRISEQAEVD